MRNHFHVSLSPFQICINPRIIRGDKRVLHGEQREFGHALSRFDFHDLLGYEGIPKRESSYNLREARDGEGKGRVSSCEREIAEERDGVDREGVDSGREGGKWEAVERKIMQRAELQITRYRSAGVPPSGGREMLLFVPLITQTAFVAARKEWEKECAGRGENKGRDENW